MLSQPAMKLAFHQLRLSLLVLCFTSFAAGATLQKDEVKALKDIAKRLGKKDWNFTVDPCSGQHNWITPNAAPGFENSVTCNCSFANGTLCHVVSIVLKSQSLPGTLPPQLAKLPYLYELDLTRNYLNGTIPKEWGSMKLVNVTLLGNRLTGPIPVELANITTLKLLVLEYNQFSGNLPPELGNLSQLERLRLTSNNFTGQIPTTFARLIKLKDLRIGDNQFSGKIPDVIQNLTTLNKLIIQRSGFNGPIPFGISFLKHLTDLRITDLDGPKSPFPLLSNNLTNWKSLILRSCNISGTLPEYLGQMTNLDNLDLSYNKINGELPSSFDGLRYVNQIYLTGNLLTGPIPEWAKKPDHIDLSYNNFSIGDLERMTCQNDEKIVSCLANIRCPQMWYSIHINCGGKPINYGNKLYDDDSREAGPARFHQTGTNWAFSSTGHFYGSDRKDYYTWSNTSKLTMENVELYMDARVSPISLTYYGFCLGNGNYTISLHFAEIMFPNDHTYNSLGRRVFDIYIQGKLVLKDFNIVEEAGGAGKAIIRKFTSSVISNTLEIHFYWAGRGTNAIPFKAVYGPLVSAISVDPNFTPPSKKGNSIPMRIVIAIVAASIIITILVFLILWSKGCLGQKNSLAQELNGLELQASLFTLKQIKVATNNFDIANKIGEGGFGPVYKGLLSDHTRIAVKQLSSRSRQGNREFVNEIGMISALQHPYLVKLYGCCMEGDQLLLIYEYMENNCLARALFGPEKCQIKLDWPTRQSICVGIAKGLAYLHEESRLKIVHRDIKATNVLLDKDLNPKISDFGLAKLHEEEDTHISTRIAGTYGYMAPEYAMRGYLTDKADVYSFGVVALEIVSGRTNLINRPNMEESFSLLDWAYLLKENGNLMELVDQRLGLDFNKEEVMVMINVALLCTHISPMLRPTMSSVVSMLEGKIVVQKVASEQSDALNVVKFEAIQQYYKQKDESVVSESTENKSIQGDETTTFLSDANLSSTTTLGSY